MGLHLLHIALLSLAGPAVAPDDRASTIGSNYCMANPNTTGVAGSISGAGSAVAADNDLTLTATNLPAQQFGFFLVSMTQGFNVNVNGTSNGNLCVVGNVGRYASPGQIMNSGSGGTFSLTLDLTLIPQGAGTVAVAPGDTWNFQAWHRDTAGFGSNLTDALEVLFL